MAVFDATTLIHLFEPSAPAVKDPCTGKSIPDAAQRVEPLIKKLSDSKEKVVIPTPALSEVLVHADQAVGALVDGAAAATLSMTDLCVGVM